MGQESGTLGKRYGIALVLILAIISISHWIEIHTIEKAQEDAAVINLSGKQRMLSQQIVLFAHNYVQENDVASATQLLTTVDAFERAHLSLMADSVGESSLGGLYMDRTPSTDEIVLNFIAVARAIPTHSYPHALLSELKEKGSGIVLERLDEAVRAYETRTKHQAQWIHTLQELTLLVAAFIIILEALFIFLPAHRMVRHGFEKLRNAAETDSLTLLRNRSGFERDLAAAMQPSGGEDKSVTLVLLDLDDFKGVNDRYGHETGDAVLEVIGHRIARLPNLLSAARIGGDEFAILVDNEQWQDFDQMETIKADIRECMDFVYKPIKCNDILINVSGSVGLSQYPQAAENIGDLRRNASASLIDAKRTGRNTLSIYNKRIDDIVYRRRIIQSALLSREYEQDLKVCFQPIVELNIQKIKSVEALARWHHEELGPLNPEEFLAIARECGLGDDVERAVRSLALAQMGPSLRAGHVESLSLNVTPVDLAIDGFAQSVIDQIAKFDVSPTQIWIEVTETERLTSRATAKENLLLLNDAGIRIALDDYGVGYSNIHRLAELPIQRVKIDKSIVGNVEIDRKYAGVFRSSIQLAHALGADVVSEGVETVGQLAEIKRLGCNLVQGYLFFKPLLAADCIAQFEQRLSVAA